MTARCVGRTSSAAKCQARCNRPTGCTAFVWRPRGDGVQRRLCPRCASRAGTCRCLRFDDVWEPVRGAESAGPGTVSGSLSPSSRRSHDSADLLWGPGEPNRAEPPIALAPAPTLAIPADTHGALGIGARNLPVARHGPCPSSALRHQNATRDPGYSLAVPVLDRCREWAWLWRRCRHRRRRHNRTGGAPRSEQHAGVSTRLPPYRVKSMSVAETVDSTCLDAAAIEDALAAGEDLSAEALAAPKSGCKTVLRIGLNHGGFFAQVLCPQPTTLCT